MASEFTASFTLVPEIPFDATFTLAPDVAFNAAFALCTYYQLTESQLAALNTITVEGDGTKSLFDDGEYKATYTLSQIDSLLSAKQNTLIAGTNITIVGNTISAISEISFNHSIAVNRDAVNAHPATSISFDPTGLNYITSTNVQEATEELDSTIKTMDNDLSVGIADTTPPTFSDNGDGTGDFGSCTIAIRDNSTHQSRPATYTVPAATLSFTDGAQEYAAIKYNSGSPIWYVETNKVNLNGSDVSLVYVVWRVGNVLHSNHQDSLALGLPNKTNARMLNTEPYTISTDGGLIISETTSPANRTITVSSAIVYAGIVPITVDSFNSSTDEMQEVVSTAGGWTYTDVSVYDNTSYNPDGSGKVTMDANKYAYRLYYRAVGDDHLFYVLSPAQYNTAAVAREAAESGRTTLPTVLKGHCVLVGRSIIQYNAATGVTESFIRTSGNYTTVVPNHDDLSNIHLAASGQTYGHIDDQAQTIAGVKTFSSFPITPSSAPTTDYQVANRKFVVDTAAAGGSIPSIVTSSTASATAAKTASLTEYTLTTGKSVYVSFSNKNTADVPTLNINSTGDIAIKHADGTAVGANNPAYFPANAQIEFWYDGSAYRFNNTIVKDYLSTVSSYYIRADGSCIQCGRYTGGSYGPTITLLTTMKDTNYCVATTMYVATAPVSSASSLTAHPDTSSFSTTEFKAYQRTGGGNSSTGPFFWEVKGYAG